MRISFSGPGDGLAVIRRHGGIERNLPVIVANVPEVYQVLPVGFTHYFTAWFLFQFSNQRLQLIRGEGFSILAMVEVFVLFEHQTGSIFPCLEIIVTTKHMEVGNLSIFIITDSNDQDMFAFNINLYFFWNPPGHLEEWFTIPHYFQILP